MTGKNFFEHWDDDVLSGEIQFSYAALLNSLHFKPGPDGSFLEKLNRWAEQKHVLLRHGKVIEHGKSVDVVYFTPLSSATMS